MRSRLAVFWRLGFLLLALFAALPPSALALTASQVYEQVKDSVVVVKAFDQKGKPVGLGSGVMLPSGDVVTNYHVVKAGAMYMVGRGQQDTLATLKAGDPDKDLCLLTAPGLTAKPARLGRSARLKVGEPVYAVGAPQGLELSLSEGIVSQLRGGPPPLIQTTVAISGGSSGGGLFNAEAELVGITTFYLKDAQSLNFALPVEWIGEVAGKKIRERPRGEAPGAPEPRAKPSDRFTVVKGGVIFDSKTALEWYVGPDRDTNWNQAKSWTENLTVAGGGWRMPTIPELKAIYQKGAGRNNIDPIFQTTDTWVWSGQMGGSSSFGSPTAGFFGFSYGKWGWVGLGAAVDGRAFAVRSRKEKIRERPIGEVPVAPEPGARPHAGWDDRVVALEKAQDWQGMLALSRRWTQAEPRNDLAWFSLGLAYANLGRHQDAIAAYREALRLKPDFAAAWYNLGVAYANLGRYREAIEAYREATLIRPDYAEAWYTLGVAYANSGNRSAALEAVKELRRYDPQKAEELFNLITKP